MTRSSPIFLLFSVVSILLGQGLAYCGREGEQLALHSIAAVAILIQWIVFIPSYFFQTERFFDFTGSLTYLSLVALSFAQESGPKSPRQIILTTFTAIWAIRLGSFLFTRINRDGGIDTRFTDIKNKIVRFFNLWTIQGLWVFITALPVFIINCKRSASQPLGARDTVGFVLWGLGFACEVIADAQKTAFKHKPANKGRWIEEGLWYYSRHPNYFGEIMLWCGVFLSSTKDLEGVQYIAILSPMFVTFLLMKVSGIPMLEKASFKKWGNDPQYQDYLARTSALDGVISIQWKAPPTVTEPHVMVVRNDEELLPYIRGSLVFGKNANAMKSRLVYIPGVLPALGVSPVELLQEYVAAKGLPSGSLLFCALKGALGWHATAFTGHERSMRMRTREAV
ncbi:hypothetical protein CYMTET_14195 [Cymbomonas tetramitiformis]|uniref:Steroid 5-alpha reductase C-terminal domain-containing protein n=1 Tax=Cymbomonas tetramitiformis TaxID=36881 RepID=A0AAE0GH43_9CHLO|nr:hypothetical protein CYMTET_14195 [Cymbomonas tetramitiformis]